MISKVAVVTVTYNSCAVLPDFLTSLAAQNGIGVHLFAVDNASADDSVKFVETESKRMLINASLIRNDQNLGVAAGNNQGILAAVDAGYDWIILLNNDTAFSASFLNGLVSLASRKNLHILSPVIEATQPEGSCWYRSGTFHPFRGMWVSHDGMWDPMPVNLPHLVEVEYASTCALLVHRQVFEKVGLMDPSYFVYGDDVDFCLRAKRDGYSYYCTSSETVYHKASSLTGSFASPFTSYWVCRNWMLVARRYCTPLEFSSGVLYMIFWTFGRAILKREMASTMNRLRAFRDGISFRPLRTPVPVLPRKVR